MIEIAMSGLGNRELFTLGVRVNENIGRYNAETLGIKLYADNFISKFDVYKTSFEKQAVSAELVSQKDEIRDDYYIALRNHIRNYQYHPEKDMKKKSKKLMAVLNKNGNMIYAASYKVETAALTAMISDMDRKYLADLEVLGAMVWYNLLKVAQADFEKAVHDFTAQKAESSKVASATKNRADLVAALNKLFMFLPLQYELTQASELGDLIGQLQAEADRF